jgi:hypothetical protein
MQTNETISQVTVRRSGPRSVERCWFQDWTTAVALGGFVRCLNVEAGPYWWRGQLQRASTERSNPALLTPIDETTYCPSVMASTGIDFSDSEDSQFEQYHDYG